jgi:DNA-binding LacI/PurR family transcriptional regulator
VNWGLFGAIEQRGPGPPRIDTQGEPPRFEALSSKVTLQDLADRIGVHRSTIALALRDHPRISPELRRKVQALAESTGYRINPLVSALMQSRRNGRAIKHVVLGYVTCYPTRFGWKPKYHDRPDYFPGAEARARELGYKLEHFWRCEPGMTLERFCDILTVRGINGLLIGRLPPGMSTLSLRWDRFSCVTLGQTLREPGLNRVTEDHYSSACLAMEQLTARGYRRIGFAFSEPDDSPRVGDRWLGAYLRQQLRLTPADRIPPLLYEGPVNAFERFAAWVVRTRPDAVLVTHATPALAWLKEMGKRVPHHLGLAALANDRPQFGASGIYCDPAKLGGLAVDLLVGMMHRGETGIPADPHESLLGGEWRPGRTLA